METIKVGTLYLCAFILFLVAGVFVVVGELSLAEVSLTLLFSVVGGSLIVVASLVKHRL